jgi:hypothetical protein
MDTCVHEPPPAETDELYAPPDLYPEAEHAPRESLEDLITNVEALVRRVGTAVDPDLARLCAAVHADVDEVRARPRIRRVTTPVWASLAVVALIAVAVSVGVILVARA